MPPTRFEMIGARVSMSSTIPGPRVLIALIASAPALTTALAISAMFASFGESLTMIGISVHCLTRRVTCAATYGVAQKNCPNSCSTLGQEIFTSIKSGSAIVIFSATLPKSQTDSAKILAMTAIPFGLSARLATRISSAVASTPGLDSPTALMSPAPQSAMAGLR